MSNPRKLVPILAIVLVVLAAIVLVPVALLVGLLVYCHYNPLVIPP